MLHVWKTLVPCILSCAGLLGCHSQECSGCPEVAIRLPALSEHVNQTSNATIHHSDSTGPVISCTWEAPAALSLPVWKCTTDRYGTSLGKPYQELYLYFSDQESGNEWVIELSGPTGSSTIRRNPHAMAEESWPTSCLCSGFDLDVTSADLGSVGLVTDDMSADAGMTTDAD